MRLHGKTAIVTGGSRGIGRAIVLGLAKEGADVVVTYVNDEKSAQLVVQEITELGRKAKAVQCDLTRLSDISRLVSNAQSFLGKIDILINNAGIVTRKDLWSIEEPELMQVLAVDLIGPFLLLQQVSQHMYSQGIKGSIVNISSISDQIAVSGLTHYQCAKAGMSMLTKGAALELAPYGIRVNTLAPGLTATDMNRTQWESDSNAWRSRVADIPLGRAGMPQDHVGAAIFLASDESLWVTGAHLAVDGGRTLF